jgi:hypothetical protein
MTGIANMNITPLEANSDQPQVPVNDATSRLAGKATMSLSVAIGNTNAASVTQDQQAQACMFTFADASPGSTANFVVTFATFGMGLF